MADEKTSSFELKGNTDNETNIRRILSDMKEASINHHNYRKYATSWSNTRLIILSQIDNETLQYNEKLDRFRELKESPRIKESLDNKLAPIELYSVVVSIVNHLRAIISWKVVEAELSQLFVEKMVSCLGEVASLDVEREVLKRMGEMVQSQSDLFAETLQSRMQTFDSKFLSFVTAMQNENRIDRKETTNMLTNALITNAQIMEQALLAVLKMIQTLEVPIPSLDSTSLESDLDGLKKQVHIEKKNQLQQADLKETPEDILSVLSRVNIDQMSRPKPREGAVVEPKKQNFEDDF